VPAGAKISLTCAGPKGACPFKSKVKHVSKAAATTALSSFFKKRKLRPGTVLTVTVTAPTYIGRGRRYAIRRGKQPAATSLCIAPGAKPAVCR
jgi:hypothetical protein